MFIGHYAVALAANRAAPQTSLGTLFMAAQWLDLIWPVFLLAGVEHASIQPGITRTTPLNFSDYPLSHSLAMVLVWAVGFAIVYFARTRYARGAWVICAAVVSHWFLDAIVHRPDLPLTPGGARFVGMGLWNSPGGTLALELTLFIVAVAFYARSFEPTDRVGRVAFWALIAFLVLTYLANIFGPPPPSVAAVAWVGLTQWLFVGWAYWIAAHRRVTLFTERVTTS